MIKTIAVAFISIVLAGCSSVEHLPIVRVIPKKSALVVYEFKPHGPSFLMNGIGLPNLQPLSPDIPTRVTADVYNPGDFRHEGAEYSFPSLGELQIVSIERISHYQGGTITLKNWRKILKSKAPSDSRLWIQNGMTLNEIPWINAARCFYGKLRYRNFRWGRAVIFITSYVQGKSGAPLNSNDLQLVIQGFTHDGRYAVNGRFSISHPDLPTYAYSEIPKGKSPMTIDDDGEAIENWLNAEPDDSFSPTITAYESLLSALEIKRGKPFRPVTAIVE